MIGLKSKPRLSVSFSSSGFLQRRLSSSYSSSSLSLSFHSSLSLSLSLPPLPLFFSFRSS